MVDYKEIASMSCMQAQRLMIPAWQDKNNLSDRKHAAFLEHLIVCQACDKEYESVKQFMNLLQQHWDSNAEIHTEECSKTKRAVI